MHFSIFNFLLSRDDEYFPLRLQFSTSPTKLIIGILSYRDAKASSNALRSCHTDFPTNGNDVEFEKHYERNLHILFRT